MKYAFLFCFLLSTCLNAQQAQRMFVFGHSLIDHRPPAIPTPSDETTVPHWVYLLAQDAGHSFAAGGKYGFLPQHAMLPPFSQWGYDIVPPVWESDTEPFSAAELTTILITAGNFVQWQGPDQEYPGDPGVTPINATEAILDYCAAEEPGVVQYIYENWPDMAPFLSNGTPASSAEFAAYNDYTEGDFHNWWIDYHDALLASRPAINVRMIPVGPTLVKILESNLANQIPFSELYEDDAPHGRASLYFLAALITYSAIFQEKPSMTYTVPTIVHQHIRDNYTAIVDLIWSELQAFNTPSGTSRVFLEGAMPVELASFSVEAIASGHLLSWQTTVEVNTTNFTIERRGEATAFTEIGTRSANGPGAYQFTDTDPLPGLNTYRLRIADGDGQISFSPMVSIEATTSIPVVNTLGQGHYQISGLNGNSHLQIVDVNGRTVLETTARTERQEINLMNRLPAGVYFLLVNQSGLRWVPMKLILTR